MDYKGTGVEFEVVVNATKNWRSVLNISLPQTERVGGFSRTIAYYNNNKPLWDSTLAALVAANDPRATAFNTDLQTIDARIASVANGKPLTGTVDYTANLFTNYEFYSGSLKGLRIGGGVNVRGERYVVYQQRIPGAGNQSTLTQLHTKGYDLVNLMAGYRTKVFGQNVDFQLNIENVFDELYKRYTTYNSVNLPDGSWVFNGNNYVFNGIPRRFLLSATVKF
jgi:outer membrane receptor for monomeric catechols